MKFNLALFSFLIISSTFAINWGTPDWSEHATLPESGHRGNIYNLSKTELEIVKKRGIKHALIYPVDVSGLFIPYDPLVNFFESSDSSPLKKIVSKVAKKFAGFSSMEELYEWVGLNPFNAEDATGIYNIPYPTKDGSKPDFYMGASIVDTKLGKGLTFSCATCHSASLFGKTVMGLTNKRVRANRFFHMAKKTLPFIPSKIFKNTTNASDEETKQFLRSKNNLPSVGVVKPQVLGLDTSLPQVALSLSRRNKDEDATKSKYYERFPRKHKLENYVSDSKPAVWWNLKYKTRWLSDGSIIKGNPVLTNFLWNELGRGTDLKELEKWMQNNIETTKELTAAVFATEAPRWTDFFDESTINIDAAKRGESHFKNACLKCHGEYQKKWSEAGAEFLSLTKQIETTKVIYAKKTLVKDMGTDPQRYIGTSTFSKELNDLKISKWMNTVLEDQKGYVPPPLVGVWARYPYLHNNSIPSLCALLTRPEKRPKVFYQGPANDPKRDYDQECVGYPVGRAIPKEWLKMKEARFDTSKKGLRNIGHSKAFIDEQGNEKFTPAQKRDLIMYLKTL
jgi:hypothetical protein